MGKTVTTEFAYLEKSRTRNPHQLAFSPGGSSSGSAAAVAAGHIPLAVGTQTGGSVIRPASYCQVHAFKPTNTAIDKTGVLQTSETLDQVGFLRRPLMIFPCCLLFWWAPPRLTGCRLFLLRRDC